MSQCVLCKVDLSVYGMKAGECPECRKAKRNVMMPCAGTCKELHTLQFMDVVKVVLNPSKKGSKTYKLYYCSCCFVPVKGRMLGVSDMQSKVMKKIDSRLRGHSK